MILQNKLGLRPSELLNIWPEDVVLPEESLLSNYGAATVGLGIRGGTKANRPQAVSLKGDESLALLRWLKLQGEPGLLLIPHSYEQFRRLLRKPGPTQIDFSNCHK